MCLFLVGLVFLGLTPWANTASAEMVETASSKVDPICLTVTKINFGVGRVFSKSFRKWYGYSVLTLSDNHPYNIYEIGNAKPILTSALSGGLTVCLNADGTAKSDASGHPMIPMYAIASVSK